MKFLLSLLPLLFAFSLSSLHAEEKEGEEHLSKLVEKRKGSPISINPRESVRTAARFQPPVEIIVVGKTESTDLRLGYAAEQMIFNWENNQHQLRVDGGPAGGKHKMGAGLIPANRYVTIKWVVLPNKQSVYVDDELRYEHEGDYSALNEPVTVFAHKAKVSLKSIKVKKL